MLLRSSALGLVCALSLGACALNDDFDAQVGRVNQSIDDARRQAIFTNILRASQHHPLTFTYLAAVHGTNTASGSAGLPTLTFGPARTGAQHQFVMGPNTVTKLGTTTFDLASVESKDFYRGLLQPIPPETVKFFLDQGIPRDFLFNLMVAEIRVVNVEKKNGERAEIGGTRAIYVNNPLHPDPDFDFYVKAAIDNGISLEFINQPDTSTPEFKLGSATPTLSDVLEVRKLGLALTPGSKDQWRLSKPTARLCFDRWAAQKPVSTKLPICGEEPQQRTLTAEGKEFSVTLRSTYGIFQYLGQLVKKQTLPDAGEEPIFAVTTASADTDCFLSQTYEDRRYCIPKARADSAARAIDLLSQLLALNTSLSDLPPASTIKITP